MKKYTMTYVLMVIPAMAIGMYKPMYKPLSEKEQVERFECIRRVITKKRQNCNGMNIERTSQVDDAMSLSRSSSGSFPIPIPIVKKQDNFYLVYSLSEEFSH